MMYPHPGQTGDSRATHCQRADGQTSSGAKKQHDRTAGAVVAPGILACFLRIHQDPDQALQVPVTPTLPPASPNHPMLLPSKILFQELSTSAAEFLHELNDPALLRNQRIPMAAQAELKRQQILKLKENITILAAKREEFNRKMEDYIRNLEALIRSLEEPASCEANGYDGLRAVHAQGTKVRCLSCEAEEIFSDLQILFAKESEESIALPTQVYVLAKGTLKKGQFRCGKCGTESLVIRAC